MSINFARLREPGSAIAAACVLAVATAGPAWAHVEAVPDTVTKGKIATITFRVPNERPDAGTVGVKLELPTGAPMGVVRVRSMPGWTSQVVKAKLDQPVKNGNTEVTEAFRDVTWTAGAGNRIAPGEFAEFAVTLGPMPASTDRLIVNAVQTYDNGEVVNWNEVPPTEGGDEPEKPAPVIALTDAPAGEAADGHGTTSPTAPVTAAAAPRDDSATWLAGSALAVGALALGVALGAVLRSRRTGSRTSTEGDRT